VLPFAVFAVVVAAGAAGAWIYTRPHVHPLATPAALEAPEQAILNDAKKVCASGDCEAAHAKLEASIPESSRWRDSQDFKDVESAWAQSVMDHADSVTDVAAKRALYQRVAQGMGVDPVRRKAAADKLQQLDSMGAGAASANAMELPVAAAPSPTKPRSESRSEDGAPVAAHAEPSHRGSTAAAEPSPSPVAANVDDRERQLALQGTPDAKLALKQQLEPRVYGGKASEAEIRLLISTCKDLGDRSCVQQARSVLAQRSQ
jgi:hypothetical protein